ncbi:flagellar hook-length control protein FliK [Vibrio aquimaris]|uniref:Flagellar hook-length control protein FliK n=1 Tax=Vibrio aquimaris TaxID=2587862 RepID=A0A5P9CHB3_9VIBR|nr:flagellar hook-length control protein FliK [Vibrio aquimaris]QFT25660.1 Flagellar hook-length control protein FliK [Vibrio aquimaris]
MQTPSLDAPQAAKAPDVQGLVKKANPASADKTPSDSFSLKAANSSKARHSVKSAQATQESDKEATNQADAAQPLVDMPSAPDIHSTLALAHAENVKGQNEPITLKRLGFNKPMAAAGPTVTSLQEGIGLAVQTNSAQANHYLTASSKVASVTSVPMDSPSSLTMANLTTGLNAAPSAPAAAAQASIGVESAAPTAQWAAIKVDTNSAKWGEQMMQVLHDRVSVQAQQNMQQAQIRLDPPDLGKMDLLVRVEGDKLSVQINASTTATREALMQVSDRLRAELQNHNFLHVDVNVGSGNTPRDPSNHSNEQQAMIIDSNEHSDQQLSLSPSEHWLSTHA